MRTVKSKSRKNPHVKLKSASCEKVGRAVEGTPPDISGIGLGVGMRWYGARREIQHWQFATRWHHCGRSERKRDATIRRGPYKGRAHVWHSLAAILTVVSMRRATH